VKTLQGTGHIRVRFARSFLADITETAFLQFGVNTFGVPILDTPADVSEDCRSAFRRRFGGFASWGGSANSGVAADERAGHIADLSRSRPVPRTHLPAQERLVEC